MPRFTIDALLRGVAAIALGIALSPAWALDASQARAIAVGDGDARIAALDAAVERADPGLAGFAQALLDDAVKTTATGVYVVRDDKAVDAVTGAPATLPDDAQDVTSNNRMRGALQAALSGLKLLSKDAGQRHAAIDELSSADPDPALLPVLDRAWAAETDGHARRQLD
ncbi:MAG TPA: urea ABC transporter permease subunit UrtB, partial [Burkholderiaceae bacterium]